MTRFNLCLSVVVVAHASGGLHACLDFTPITSLPEADAGRVPGDAGTDGVSSAPTNPCLACAAGGADGGGCPSEYATCVASAACKATVVCATDQCLMSLATVSQCLMACEDDSGASDPANPANASFSALLTCMSTRCTSSCLP